MEEKKLIKLCMSSGQYGVNGTPVECTDGVTPLLLISDISSFGDIKELPQKGIMLKKKKTYVLEENDIVLARTGETTGKSYLYDPEDGNMAFSGFLIRYRINPRLALPSYIKYYTLSSRYQSWINHHAYRTATRKSLSAKEYDNMPIPVPPLEEQKKIVHKLDICFQLLRIEVKAQSKHSCLSDDLFSYLFSGIEDNSTLGECCKIKTGRKTIKTDGGKWPLYTSGGVTGGSDECCIDGITILLPRKGSLNNTFLVSGKAMVSDVVFYLNTPNPLVTEFLYMQLKRIDRMKMGSGVAAPSLKKNLVKELPVHYPTDFELQLFEKEVHPFISASLISEKKIKNLRSICMDMVNLVWNF